MNKYPTRIQDGYWPDSPGDKENGLISIWNQHREMSIETNVIRRLISIVLRQKDLKVERLEVILTDGGHVHQLNQLWKNADYETDVLAFSLGSVTEIDAEIYINLDFAKKHCRHYGSSFLEEAGRYVVHGLLHVLGYEDDTPESKRIMKKMEDQCLGQVDFTGI